MQASDIPGKIQLPFGSSAGGSYIRPIPVPSQIPTTPGAASYTDGFPPLCFEQIALGGTPPSGADFNGILNAISAWSRWVGAGAPVMWDSAFSTAISGYPKGAIVQSATTFGTMWVCLADNNTTNPDAGGANWQKLQDWLGITAAYTAAIAAALATPTAVPGAAKSWLLYNCATTTILSSFNVASVTKNASGDYNINFTTPFSTANYAVTATAQNRVLTLPYTTAIVTPLAQTAGSVRLLITGPDGNTSGTPPNTFPYGPVDTVISVACFGNQ